MSARRHFDVIVAGLGAMGSAAAHQLARRGLRVLGLDRHAPPHTLGSTHGRTRIIREAYYEHPRYVPLLRRAYELWDALQRDWGHRLLHVTGGLMIGPEDGTLVRGARRSAEEHAIAHELLGAAEVRRRFPAYAPPADHVALLEHRAGVLLPEECVRAQLALAARAGATLRVEEPVERWRARDGRVEVETAAGRYEGAQLVLAVGAWLPELAAPLALPLTVERQLSHWFAPRGGSDRLSPDRCPLSLWEFEREHLFAAFPDFGDGVKCGVHHDGGATTPETVDRAVSGAEDALAHDLLARILPDAAGPVREARVCLYTNTPDHHFLIDRHPAHPEVLLASPCSGHGFKFASVIGELLADLATTGRTPFDLRLFELARLTA